jgi:ABC-type uncharacterized transport system YnjBCD ATPase subunit
LPQFLAEKRRLFEAYRDRLAGVEGVRLVAEPACCLSNYWLQALLLDEPFSRLDKTLRTTFREWVFDAVRARNIPVVLVTHDEDDIPPGGELIEISRWQ